MLLCRNPLTHLPCFWTTVLMQGHRQDGRIARVARMAQQANVPSAEPAATVPGTSDKRNLSWGDEAAAAAVTGCRLVEDDTALSFTRSAVGSESRGHVELLPAGKCEERRSDSSQRQPRLKSQDMRAKHSGVSARLDFP